MLLAYTFSKEESRLLEEVLSHAAGEAKWASQDVGTDSEGRGGRKYFLSSEPASRLQTMLGTQFERDGTFSLAGQTGQPYACKEITLGGKGRGCEEFLAADAAEAFVVCALIAGQKYWFSGVASPGFCAKRSW